MLKIFDKLLLCVRIAYWYEYTDDLKGLKGNHCLGFVMMTIFSTVFCVGILALISVLYFIVYQYDGLTFVNDLITLILISILPGTYMTYLLCYKNNRYLAGKEYLSEFPIEQQIKIGKKYVTRCWYLACSPGFVILFLMALKTQ